MILNTNPVYEVDNTMLHNPLHDMPSILNVKSFKDWLDRQPPEKRYNYGECWTCAIAQYVTSHLGYAPDGKSVVVTHEEVRVNGKWFLLPPEMTAIAFEGEHTFGAAAQRAEAY